MKRSELVENNIFKNSDQYSDTNKFTINISSHTTSDGHVVDTFHRTGISAFLEKDKIYTFTCTTDGWWVSDIFYEMTGSPYKYRYVNNVMVAFISEDIETTTIEKPLLFTKIYKDMPTTTTQANGERIQGKRTGTQAVAFKWEKPDGEYYLVAADPQWGSNYQKRTGGVDPEHLWDIFLIEGNVLEDVDNTKISVIGKSAYQIAVENGFKGTEQEWLDSLKSNPIDEFMAEVQPDGHLILHYYEKEK